MRSKGYGGDAVSDHQDRALTNTNLNRSVGQRLRAVREELGWSRAQLVAKLGVEMHVQTIGTYESGHRQLTIARYVALCEALGVPAPELLAEAIRRAEVDAHFLVCTVDLRRLVAASDDPVLEPLRRWARNRLESGSDDGGIVHLEPESVAELAVFCGLTHVGLFRRLATYAPVRSL
nr:helix-turn-helix transcriptional regulator [Actinokineospora enzanensis]